MNNSNASNRKQLFEEWLLKEVSKRNTIHITEIIYNQIVQYLKDRNDGKDLSSYAWNIRRRVKRKQYHLMSYPTLGMNSVLCGATDMCNVCFCEWFHLLCNFFLKKYSTQLLFTKMVNDTVMQF